MSHPILPQWALDNAIRSEANDYYVQVAKECRDILDNAITGLFVEGKLGARLQGKDYFRDVRYEMGEGHRDVLLEYFREQD